MRTPGGKVDGAVIEPPEDADQEAKDIWKQHNELERKLQHIRGEMGAQAAKRRKVNLASPQGAEYLSACQGRRFFFAAASLASKSVKGSHGGVLVVPMLAATWGNGC